MFIFAFILLTVSYGTPASAQFSYSYKESLLQGKNFMSVRFDLESTELQEIENSFKYWKCKNWNPRNTLGDQFNSPGSPDYLNDDEACELVMIKVFLDHLYSKSPLKNKVGLEETLKVAMGCAGSDCHAFSLTTVNWINWLSQKEYLHHFSLEPSGDLPAGHRGFILSHQIFGIPNVHVATPLRLGKTKKFIVLDAWLADQANLSARTMIFSESEFVGVVNFMEEASGGGRGRIREY